MEKLPIAAYILAGGRSSRMGQNKALLSLADRTLVQHAVRKLQRFAAEVSILGKHSELAPFAPLVPDLHEDCGPLGGIEAALAHTHRDWVLILPVDMPFLPADILETWTASVLRQPAARIALFVIDGVPQPAVCLLHREVAPLIATAIEQKRFKLYPVLEEAASVLAHRQRVSPEKTLLRTFWTMSGTSPNIEKLFAQLGEESGEERLTQGQRAAVHLWFANLNTPEEFAEAELHLDALDR